MQRDQDVAVRVCYGAVELLLLVAGDAALRFSSHAGIEKDESPACLVVNVREPNTLMAQIVCDSSRRIMIPGNHEDREIRGKQELLESAIGLRVSTLSEVSRGDDQIGICPAPVKQHSFQGGEGINSVYLLPDAGNNVEIGDVQNPHVDAIENPRIAPVREGRGLLWAVRGMCSFIRPSYTRLDLATSANSP